MGCPVSSRATRWLLSALSSAALVWPALAWPAALSAFACSSSDDVVASLDEPALSPPPASAAGAPLHTIVHAVSDPAPTAGAPAPAPPAPPIAGSAATPAGSVPAGAAAGIGEPPPPDVRVLGEALFISGSAQSPLLEVVERWPIDLPLRRFFPAPELQPVHVTGPISQPLRELAARWGLGVEKPAVQLRVEDAVGDQFEVLLSEDPALAELPLRAEE